MRAWLVLIAALAFGIAPFITEGFAGFRPEQFPIPQDGAPVQPAGYAFSIWSVIYLWLLVSAVYGVWRHRDDPLWEPARIPIAISMGVGAIWIKVANISVIWATVLIWVMLLSALWAVFLGREGGPKWALSLPLGLYAGWLTAASFVALGLTGAGYGILGDAWFWAVMMILCALGFGVMNQNTFQGVWTYGVALAWALTGIVVANWGATPSVAILAGIGAVLISALTARQTRIFR